MARRDARHVTDLDEEEAGFSVVMGRAARRASDGFACVVALGLAGGVIANIFFLQDRVVRSAGVGTTTVSVEPKAKAAPVAGPGTPAMIFAPATPVAPTAPSPALAPTAPRAAAPASVAPAPVQEAMVPPASLPVPKTPSPVVADIQRELARRGFYDGAVDGLSGPKTEGAVRAFEQAARLKVGTGEPTDAVLAELRRAPMPATTAAPPVASAAPRPAAPPAQTAPYQPAPTAGGRPMLPPAAVPGDAGVTGSVRPPGDVGGSNRILAVQKSLARLGYGPIKVDGQPGSDTRQAILRFERDRNLPATGEINDRLIRELSAVSGMPVQ